MHLEDILAELGQTELRMRLESSYSKELEEKLVKIDWPLLKAALKSIHQNLPPTLDQNIEPPVVANPTDLLSIEELKGIPLACVIMAGGQGTRLEFDGPKGLFPLNGTTLFELHIEKLKALSELLQSPLKIAIMTSEVTHLATLDYFKRKNWFGVPQAISLFNQKNLPLLSSQQQIIVEETGAVLTGPDGNGGLFEAMLDSGLLKQWEKESVPFFAVMPIDNALAEPFDLRLLTQQIKSHEEMTWAAVCRTDPQEKVGLFVRTGNQQLVVEYSEISPELTVATNSDGVLLFREANISQFLVRMDTAARLSRNQTAWHVAKKSRAGKSFLKLERFIFDHLPQVHHFSIVEIDRARCFAPIKNATGIDSPKTAIAALQARGFMSNSGKIDNRAYCAQWQNIKKQK